MRRFLVLLIMALMLLPIPTNAAQIPLVGPICDGYSNTSGMYQSTHTLIMGDSGIAYFSFWNIEIPDGATINDAHLDLQCIGWDNGTHLKIRGWDAENPYPPGVYQIQLYAPRTTAAVDWDSGYSDNCVHNSPDITSIIQELVDSYTYDGTTKLCLLIDNDGSDSGSDFTCCSWDGDAFGPGIAPTLTVDWGTRINMFSYGNHNATYDNRIIAMRPEMVIDNPAHGLYGEMAYQIDEVPYGEATWLLVDPSIYQDVGCKVYGYITGGYEGTGGDDGYDAYWYSLETNEMLIENMATYDGVDGVFIDECSSYPDATAKYYLAVLAQHAHDCGLQVWGNVGVDNFDSWYFGHGFDLMGATEAWQGSGQSLSQVEQDYGSRISVARHGSGQTATSATTLTVNAWSRGIRYCYVNKTAYTSIASWFETYAANLRAVQGDY